MVLPSAKNSATIGGQVHVRDLCCRARTRVSPPLHWERAGVRESSCMVTPCTLTLTLSLRGEEIVFVRYGLYRRELCASC